MDLAAFETLLTQAISARFPLFDPQHQMPCRLFNGFLEGEPRLVIDLYATTVVLHNYANPPEDGHELIAQAQQIIQTLLPWVQAIVLKTRRSSLPAERDGRVLVGDRLAQRVREHGAQIPRHRRRLPRRRHPATDRAAVENQNV